MSNFKEFPFLRDLTLNELSTLRPINDHLVRKLRNKNTAKAVHAPIKPLNVVPNIREEARIRAQAQLERERNTSSAVFRLPNVASAKEATANKGYCSVGTPYDAYREWEFKRHQESKAKFVAGDFASGVSRAEANDTIQGRAFLATGQSEQEIRNEIRAVKARAKEAKEREMWRARVEAHRLRCISELNKKEQKNRERHDDDD